jgi:c-di-GMP-binding flagellar brake protein YcgR
MPQKKAVRRRERRIMSRADAQLSMRVEGPGGDGALAPIVTESRNISGSGVYCVSPHYLAPLSKVAVTIVLPGLPGRTPRQRLLKCEGVVVRCQTFLARGRERAYELACSFLDLEDRARALLDEFVLWRNLRALRPAPARATRTATARNGARGATARTTGRAASTRTPRKRRTIH